MILEEQLPSWPPRPDWESQPPTKWILRWLKKIKYTSKVEVLDRAWKSVIRVLLWNRLNPSPQAVTTALHPLKLGQNGLREMNPDQQGLQTNPEDLELRSSNTPRPECPELLRALLVAVMKMELKTFCTLEQVLYHRAMPRTGRF